MRKVSTILFWIGELFSVAIAIVLFNIGSIFKIEVKTPEYIIEGVIMIICAIIAIPVRLGTEEDRPVLAGVWTILLVGNVAIASAILLFVVNGIEQNEVRRSLNNPSPSSIMENALKDGEVPLMANSFKYRLKYNQERFVEGAITKEVYEQNKSNIRLDIKNQQVLLKNYETALNSKLERQIITNKEYEDILCKLHEEKIRLDNLLYPAEE